jgi:cysteine desulfurase family protein (TIGR01976 family)
MPELDIAAVRARFPALGLRGDGGGPTAFFDGPGGTQVPDTVIEAVANYYRRSNANHGGAFGTSRRSDAIVAEAHAAVADLVNASSPDEIKLGANMTTLTFHISRSIARTMAPGDEIVVTGLDHEANVGPWLAAAADRGVVVRVWEPRLADCTLNVDDLDSLLNSRTRLVAVGWASNAVGTINPIAEIVRRVHAAGAWVYVDAVHAAPHTAIDVRAVDADFLVCSAYKFFGPHVGALYGKAAILEALPPYKVRPADDRFETGTGNFEGYAGMLAAVEYIASIGAAGGVPGEAGEAGEVPGGTPSAGPRPSSRRARIVAAMAAIRAYEMDLYRQLADGLDRVPGLKMYGIGDRSRFAERMPTAAIRIGGLEPRFVAEALARQDIAVWDGDFYATGLIERLGLATSGGVVRIGLIHYNTAEEVERVVDALARIAAGGQSVPSPSRPVQVA